MIILVIILFLLAATVYLFMKGVQFGGNPSGSRLQKIKSSPHYKNGQFQNLAHTPALTEGASYTGVMREFFFGKNKRGIPSIPLPSKKTNLSALDIRDNVLIWFGHSSYFLQVDGKKWLVDPVLSGHASPVKFTTRSFKGSDVYTVNEIPDIDYLLISHDHYDHLDHQTIVKLRPKIKKVITGLGTGAHLERWGYDPELIIEKDWDEELILQSGFSICTVTARHFSGRAFKRNNTLWLSFVLKTPSKKIFIGGDSGYGDHFKQTGEQHGPFDLVILECGQYNRNWKYIHMMPEEVVQAAQDLKAKTLLPVHWAKFSLAIHAWDEPITRVTEEANRKGMPVVHPMIGQAVDLEQMETFAEWWKAEG